MKKMYVDVGELGWSLYLSGHMRWLKEHTDDYIAVTTHADRHCLYNRVVDAVYSVPDDFYTKFRRGREVFFGLRGVSATELSDYFAKRINSKYELKGVFGYKIKWDKIIFKALHLKGIYGREMFETWYKMEQMILTGLDITPIITHRFNVNDFMEGFKIMEEGNCGKVILDWE